jgi:hypothetical protein
MSIFAANQVTAAKLAVDREVEQRQVSQFVGKLEPGANGPDLPWQKRTFLADQRPLVPRRALRSGCWKLGFGHGEVSIQPSHTRHRHLAAARILPRDDE